MTIKKLIEDAEEIASSGEWDFLESRSWEQVPNKELISKCIDMAKYILFLKGKLETENV